MDRHPSNRRGSRASSDELGWAILAAGVLTLGCSFLRYYRVGPSTVNAWHGLFGWFAVLLSLAGSAAVAVDLFARRPTFAAADRLMALGAYGLAALCAALAFWVVPADPDRRWAARGHALGYWLSMIVIAAGAVLCVVRLRQGGGRLPGSIGAAGRPRSR